MRFVGCGEAVLPLQSGLGGMQDTAFPLNTHVYVCRVRRADEEVRRGALFSVFQYGDPEGSSWWWGPWGRHPLRSCIMQRALCAAGKMHPWVFMRKEGTCHSLVPASAASHSRLGGCGHTLPVGTVAGSRHTLLLLAVATVAISSPWLGFDGCICHQPVPRGVLALWMATLGAFHSWLWDARCGRCRALECFTSPHPGRGCRAGSGQAAPVTQPRRSCGFPS